MKSKQVDLLLFKRVIGKDIFVSLLLLIFVSFNVQAQTRGTVKRSLTMKSEILNQSVNFSIYLPVSYDSSNISYPVLYLLHGFTDNENTWIDNGWVDHAADHEILNLNMDEMIIVMPDGGLNWFVNSPNNDFDYEDMFIMEFIPYIESTYKTRSAREQRFIGGLSMGGIGAIRYVLQYPDTFSACIAFSSALKTDDNVLKLAQEQFDFLYQSLYGTNVQGANRLSHHWKENNPLNIINQLSDEQLKSIKWYLSCGDDDALLEGNIAIHKMLICRNIPHEFRIKNGKHNWDYWRRNISEGLNFLSETN